MNGRCVRILEYLTNNNKIKVTLLAELMDISQVTLRKDLDNLEKLSIIRRKHGYASLDNADVTGRRIAQYYSIKRRIAKAAAQKINDGETLMLESGSCCALFAEELAASHNNITIITNSIFIADYIRSMQKSYPRRMLNINLILLGGCFQPESRVLVGSIAVKSASEFYPDKFFLGADGFIPGQGFTGSDHFRAETALGLAGYARNVFILTEAAKFLRSGAFNLIQFDKITGVFTDDNITKEAEAELIKNNVQVVKVPSVDETISWRQFPGMLPILYKEKK